MVIASATSQPPIITSVDRFALTLSLAIICHALIILGISFVPEKAGKQSRFETMEIVLVQQKSEPPKESDLLAQANFQGGADEKKEQHSTQSQVLPNPAEQQVVMEQPPTEQTVEHTTSGAGNDKVLAVKNDTKDVAEIKLADGENEADKNKDKLDAATLIANSLKIASLTKKIRRQINNKSKSLKHKRISASTKEYKYAAYMEAWRAKVERIGNLNYPQAAHQKQLSGSLVLDVALKSDGSVHSINIHHSSGYKILDDAAVRIVKLAAPYAPFPRHIKDETDILHIFRTWQFINQGIGL